MEGAFAGDRDVALGGGAIASAQANTQVGNDLARAELLAFPFIFLLSLLFFRSLVASLLPPLLGALAILVTFFALRIVSGFTDLSVFALSDASGGQGPDPGMRGPRRPRRVYAALQLGVELDRKNPIRLKALVSSAFTEATDLRALVANGANSGGGMWTHFP